MSKVAIDIDLDTNILNVSINDKKIKDIQEVRISQSMYKNSDGNFPVRVEVISGTYDEDNKIGQTIITTLAKEQTETKPYSLASDLAKALKIIK